MRLKIWRMTLRTSLTLRRTRILKTSILETSILRERSLLKRVKKDDFEEQDPTSVSLLLL